MKNRFGPTFAVLAGLLLCACAALRGGSSVPTVHPEKLEPGNPKCTECHETSLREGFAYARFNHTASFGRQHRGAAYQQERVCSMCHTQSFCNDCHATYVELKPSTKNQTETYRQFPHWGDYLSRHRIDARVDPTSCFRCHGNPKSSKTCAGCHG